MEPPKELSASAEIRYLEISASSKKDVSRTKYANLAKLIGQWREKGEDVEEASKKTKLSPKDLDERIKLRQKQFLARKHHKIPIDEADFEVEKVWTLRQQKAALEKKIKSTVISIYSAEREFYNDIELAAQKYIATQREPSNQTPFYSDLKLRIAAIKSQNFQQLNQDQLKALDAELDPIFIQLLEDASKPRLTTPYLSLIKLIDLFRVNPEYTIYRLSKMEAPEVAKMIFQELGVTGAKETLQNMVMAALDYEIKHKITLQNQFLRTNTASELLIVNFQNDILDPILENTANLIQMQLKEQALELEPKETTTDKKLAEDQAKLKGFATFSLKKIDNTLQIKKLPKELRQIYQKIFKASGNVNLTAALFFLRYMNPALLINDINESKAWRRNMVLLSKIILAAVNNEVPNAEWMRFLSEKAPGEEKSFLEASQSIIRDIVAKLITPDELSVQ